DRLPERPRRPADSREGAPGRPVGGGQPRRGALRRLAPVPSPARRPVGGQHRRRRLPGLPLAPVALRRHHRRDGGGTQRLPRLPRSHPGLHPVRPQLQQGASAAGRERRTPRHRDRRGAPSGL
ncbi:MAG: hypothetical protein AVDCRST_MAG60-1568, partial [uncultured Nocardioides sp.]